MNLKKHDWNYSMGYLKDPFSSFLQVLHHTSIIGYNPRSEDNIFGSITHPGKSACIGTREEPELEVRIKDKHR